MANPAARVRISTLVREELRALPRNAFALGAIVLLLGLFAPIAALAYSGPDGVSDTLIFTWVIAELVVGIVVAARVAAARRSRFVDSLYTTPLDARTWFVAQAVVGLVLAALVMAAQLPFLLLHVAYLGVPAMLPSLALGAVLMGFFAVALGLFCGVVVGDSGPGAAAGIAGGVGFLAFMLMLLHGVVLSAPPSAMQAAILRATSLSPLALVMDGVGISVFDMIPAARWRPLVGLAGLVLGLAGASWLAYTRAQGPLGWESRRGGARLAVVALAALALVVPVASAEVTFTEEDEEFHKLSLGEHTQVAFVARGAEVHAKTFTLSSIYDSPDLPLGEAMELDALVLLKVPADAEVRGVRIEVVGSEAVSVEGGGVLSVPSGTPEGRGQPGSGWASTQEGAPRPYYRVPVVLRATSVEALSDSPAPVEVRTQFFADGRALTSEAKIPLDAEIPGATAQLILAGLPLPLAALAAFVTRRIRTR